MTRWTPISAAARLGVVAGLIALSMSAFGTGPADAAMKKTQLECSDDWVECVEYCDKFEKPTGGPNHKTCIQACQYTYDKCTGAVPGLRPTRINSGVFLPGTSPGVYDTGSSGQPVFQSPLPTKKVQ
jgi:hypothetical protein